MKKALFFLLLMTGTLTAQDRIEKNLGDFNVLKTYRGLQVELINRTARR